MKKNEIDILIVGHTHLPLFYVYEDKIIINPGSFTGAWSGGSYRVRYKGYCVLDVVENRVIASFFVEKLG